MYFTSDCGKKSDIYSVTRALGFKWNHLHINMSVAVPLQPYLPVSASYRQSNESYASQEAYSEGNTASPLFPLEWLVQQIHILLAWPLPLIHSSIPLACAEFDDSLRFSGASSIPLCYVLFPATLPHQLFFHPLSPHLAIYFLVYLSILLFPNSYIILCWEFYFLPFSIHVQTIVIYLTLLSLL